MPIAVLRNDCGARLGRLTERQILDAAAVGQCTPRPVFTTATFVGRLVAGAPGATPAMFGIGLPSFVSVALPRPIVPRPRGSPWSAALLDGANMAAIGLMAAVA